MVSSLIDQYPDRFAVVEMHVQYDGFETPWGDDRLTTFYGTWCGGGAPIIMYDGYYFWDPPDYAYGLEQRLNDPTDVIIDVTATEVATREWDFSASICIEPGGTARSMRIHAVQTLDHFPDPPSYSRNTLRQALQSQDIELAPGECSDVEFNFTFEPESWTLKEFIKVTVWAQEAANYGPALVFQASQVGWPFPEEGGEPADPEYPRAFELALPLFDGDYGAWLEDASSADIVSTSGEQVEATYRSLCGDPSGLYPVDDPPVSTVPDIQLLFDDGSVPIFAAGSGQQEVLLCDYRGFGQQPNVKWGDLGEGGPVGVPSCSGMVRPAGPVGLDSDGLMVLYDASSDTEYDFWQATTVSNGECQSDGAGLPGTSVSQAGQADFFDTAGSGASWSGAWGVRAAATPLLAGLILPEDVADGEIAHALAVAVPGLRNRASEPDQPLSSDVVYPASFTDTERYSTNPEALAAGQRLRLRGELVGRTGQFVDEDQLAPITRMVVDALRSYGAYAVESGNGFLLFAEDIHTADLQLDDDAVNALIGEPAGTPLPSGKTRWQTVMETLAEELADIPFAHGVCNGMSSTLDTANFEVVDPATAPPESLPAPRRPVARREVAFP